MVWPENHSVRSQDFDSRFHDAGQFYWVKPDILKKKGQIFTNNCSFIVVSELEVQDVDTLDDWAICELKYKLINHKK
jgi:N-acylneuraminate cytidylyltransferase